MDFSLVKLDPEHFGIDKKQLAQLAGFDAHEVPDPFEGIIQTEIDYLLQHCVIQGGFGLSGNVKIQPERGMFQLDGVAFHIGKKIAKYLWQSEQIAFYVCTVGDAVSKRPSKLMDTGNMLEGYIADLAGNLLVENAMNWLHAWLAGEMKKKGLAISNRYSPGYWSWNVSEQHKLFDFFPDGFCGVQLYESGMMSPVKTVSGVIGAGRNMEFHKYLCEKCTSLQCIYRHKKDHFKPIFTCY
jgi:hypothetical protein